MSIVLSGKYSGNKKVELLHESSGVVITTDAPRDIQGEGKSFSPTDLLAASFASCVLTTMAVVADRNGISLEGMHFRIEKQMNDNPRRVGSLTLEVHMPSGLLGHERSKLERAAFACPVHQSLHTEISAPISFTYDV